jgi:hypothetical protein
MSEDESNEFGAAIGLVMEYGMRCAMLGLHRCGPDVHAAMLEAINDGERLLLTVELSPEARLAVTVGELCAFSLEP